MQSNFALSRSLFAIAFVLVADETTFTRGASARNEQGREVPPESPAAVRWCSLGALHHAKSEVEKYYAPRDSYDAMIEVYRALTRGLPMISRFNDLRSHAEIVSLWRSVGQAHGWLDSPVDLCPHDCTHGRCIAENV